MQYLEIILPLPIPGTFTYKLPGEVHDQDQLIGCRAIVQFGKRKIYTGIIFSVHNDTPKGFNPKEIIDLLDDEPVINETQLHYFEWISEYYMSTLGEVINAALPAGLKMSSESYLSLNPELDEEDFPFSEKEQTIINHLKSGDLKVNDVGDLLNIKSAHPYIKRLKESNAIQVFEQIKDKYTPKKESRVKLSADYVDESNLDELLEALDKRKKQQEAIVAYVTKVPLLESPSLNEQGVIRKELVIAGASESSIKTLIKNGIFIQWDQIISRLDLSDEGTQDYPTLSEKQQLAKEEILTSFQKNDTVLLKGITGSGKTEIYISMILDVINNGGQVLYLLPEIALTTQIINRLSKFFGNQFGVYHSKYSDNERVEVWQKVASGEFNFVVGVRSAIFLPFTDLSLIIVDEEHESSFKQYDPAPRYNARDAAIYLASMFHAKTLLGTATPALETYHNALEGKYGLVRLDERYSKVVAPGIEFANLIQERKQRKLKGNFSSKLLGEIHAAIENQKQVILFQNRRGYAPYLTCNNCGYIPKCPHCDVSLTYHIHQDFLICHYCGHKASMINSCVQCNSNDIRTMSFGTEKIEEELEILMPTVRIRRMDLDSTRSKYSYQRIIEEFENREIDILIGTQMVSKGLDFDDVALVGVFDADRLIHFPDFRSHERAFQLIHQVSGRAGRRDIPGKVVIQTSDPDQHLLQSVQRHDYEGFYQSEILERERFHYPPFHRIISITIKDPDKLNASNASQFFARELKKSLGDFRVIGPVEPLIGRIRNQYLYNITIKIEKQGVSLRALKEFLLNSRTIVENQRSFKGVRIQFDVDPL